MDEVLRVYISQGYSPKEPWEFSLVNHPCRFTLMAKAIIVKHLAFLRILESKQMVLNPRGSLLRHLLEDLFGVLVADSPSDS